jgi:hypothetical protein
VSAARWIVVVALFACAKQAQDEGGQRAEGPSPMKKEEQDRGIQLCEGYVARVCACAAKDPTLQGQCDLSRSQPEALRMPLALLNGAEGKLNDNERRMSEAAARKIIAACVRSDGALPLDKCPRP